MRGRAIVLFAGFMAAQALSNLLLATDLRPADASAAKPSADESTPVVPNDTDVIDRRQAPFLSSLTSVLLPKPVSVALDAIEETCDDIDNDGDGEIDEALTRPCASACASGTETCAAGEWMRCTARPCCDTTVGPGLPTSSICPAAETADSTLCLMPGVYSVPLGCKVRSSLVGLGNPGEIIIEGDVRLTETLGRIQGVTITGLLQSEEPLDLIRNQLLNGVWFNNDDFFPLTPLLQIVYNDVQGLINIELPSFIHANSISAGIALNRDHADRHIVTANHVFGGGITIAPFLSVYLAGNLIEGDATGIHLPCYVQRAHIVANRILAGGDGVNVCVEEDTLLLRNDISYGGELGVYIKADRFRIEGNQIVRDPNAPASSTSRGITAWILTETCPACGGSLRDNTVVGSANGIRVEHFGTGSYSDLTGNIVLAGLGTGVTICAQDQCPASTPYAVTALGNNVQAGSTLWAGTDDPTGVDGNISADPLFVDPAAGDYRLDAGSPCIDAGVPGELTVDLPGRPRSLDGDGDGTAAPDMGAWESGSTCSDGDGDGYGSPGNAECPAGGGADCDDLDPLRYPGAAEACNRIDDNCDGILPAVEHDLDDDGIATCEGDCLDTDPSVRPGALERCRNEIDDDCNGLTDNQETACLSTTCIVIVLGAPGTPPSVSLVDYAACPVGGILPRAVDIVRADAGTLTIHDGLVDLGTVEPIACAILGAALLFDPLRPDPGQADFYFVRETVQPSYGTGSSGLPRFPDAGDCP